MKSLKKPKKVQKSQKNYLSNEQFQDYSEQQFSEIYSFLEADVLFDDVDNTKTTLNFGVNLGSYSVLEIFYTTSRDARDLRGSQKLYKPVGTCININNMFRVSSTREIGTTSLYEITQNSISLVTGSAYEFTNNNPPIMNDHNVTYIIGVVGYK